MDFRSVHMQLKRVDNSERAFIIYSIKKTLLDIYYCRYIVKAYINSNKIDRHKKRKTKKTSKTLPQHRTNECCI